MEITQEWITQYNKKCAEFLFPELVDIDDTGIWGINICLIKNKQTKYEILNNHDSNIFISIELKFHSDWNWIMEVVEKIEKDSKYVFSISQTISKIYDPYYDRHKRPVVYSDSNYSEGNTKKINCVITIDKFIDWYNKQKEL